jgi:surface carbohydrate biosynthesis protein
MRRSVVSRPDGPRVALIVDHPQRDLAGLTLTAVELCQHGFTCHFVPLNLQDRELFALAPDFVVLNFLRRGTEPLAHGLVEAGIGLGLLDTEGIVWAEYKDYTDLLWEEAGLRGAVECLCLWGEKLGQHLAQQGLFAADRMRVTGCPRFDFYAPQWRAVLAQPVDRGDRCILLNTQYSMTNPRFTTVERHIQDFRSHFGWSEESIRTKMEIERAAVGATIALAEDLARDFPAVPLVIRPHPHESPEPYRRALADRPNVSFSLGGPVQPDIFRAAVVIQRNCTTSVEAGLAGVPTLSPDWIPSWFRMELAERVSLPTQTYPELRSVVADIFDGGAPAQVPVRRELDQVIRDWFCANDGCSHRRVTQALLPVLRGRPGPQLDRCYRGLHGLLGPTAWDRVTLGRRLRHVLGLPVEFSFGRLRTVAPSYWSTTDKRFDATAVTALATRIQQARLAQGHSTLPVSVDQARDRGAYHFGYCGHAVTMSPAS